MLGCMAHVLNLAAQAAIKSFSNATIPTPPSGLATILNDKPKHVDLSSSVSQISRLVSFLKQSPQKAASFYEIVKGMIGTKISMVASVSTRWNYTFAILDRVLEICADIDF